MNIKSIDVWELPPDNGKDICLGCSSEYVRPEVHDIGFCAKCISRGVERSIGNYQNQLIAKPSMGDE